MSRTSAANVQQFKAILKDHKKHSNTANIANRLQTSNVPIQNGSKWQNATALLFCIIVPLPWIMWISQIQRRTRHVCTEMVKTSLLSSCCKLQVPLKVPCNAEFVFAIVACILKLILGSHRLEIKMCSSFFMLVFIVYTSFNVHFLSFIAHMLLLFVFYFHVYSCFIICICSWISCVLQH